MPDPLRFSRAPCGQALADRGDVGRVGGGGFLAAAIHQGRREPGDPKGLGAEGGQLRVEGRRRDARSRHAGDRGPLQLHRVALGAGLADVAAPERDVDAGLEGVLVAGEPLEAEHGAAPEEAGAAGGEFEPDDARGALVRDVVVDAGREAEARDAEETPDAAVERPVAAISPVSLRPDGGDSDDRAPEVAHEAEMPVGQEERSPRLGRTIPPWRPRSPSRSGACPAGRPGRPAPGGGRIERPRVGRRPGVPAGRH